MSTHLNTATRLDGFRIGALALLLFTSGCNSLNDGARGKTPPTGELAWVAQQFTGGRQCETDNPYTPPATETLLAQAGVESYETRIESLAVCEACYSCPAYSAVHYALIRKSQLAAAQKAGFETRDPPPTP